MARNIIVLGASKNKERYSNIVVRLLKERKENVFPVNPLYDEIEGYKCYKSISEIEENKIDIITIYVSPEILNDIYKEILEKKVDKVIFNPETENPEIEKILENAGIKIIKACSIVLLKTNRF